MFTDLPDVLQDLVVQFAFKIDKKELKGDLDLIFEIKRWKLHPCFLRHRVFVSDPWIFVNNPLETYFPLQKLKSMFEIFDMCVIHELLDRFDFRKKEVRCMGSRANWIGRLDHWEFLKWFSSFFNKVVVTPGNLKPMWQGFPLFIDGTKKGFF